MTFVISGVKAWVCNLTRAVGRGSREQVEGFICRMMSSVCCRVMGVKQERGWDGPDCWLAVRGGEEGVSEREERIVSTFALKYDRKLLHFSVVIDWFMVVFGLRKWFMVEKSRFELPGLLLMTLE